MTPPGGVSSCESGPAPREQRSPPSSPSPVQRRELGLELGLGPRIIAKLKDGEAGLGVAEELSPSPDVASLGAEVETGTGTETETETEIAIPTPHNGLEGGAEDGDENLDVVVAVDVEPEFRLPGLGNRAEPGMGDVAGREDGEREAAEMEIPDSEADTEEAASPAKSDVVGLKGVGDGKGSGSGEVDADEAQDQEGRREEQSGKTEAIDEDLLVRDEFPEAVEAGAEVARSPKPKLESTAKANGATQDPILEATHDQNLASQSKELPARATAAANSAIQDSVTSPFIDDESMVISSVLTTSDLQPPTQATQATEQDEIVDSHFADAVAVMSDVGTRGNTQEIAASTERDEVGQTTAKEFQESAARLVESLASSAESSACMVDAVQDLKIPAFSAEQSVTDAADESVVEAEQDTEDMVTSEQDFTNQERVESSPSGSRDQSGDIEMPPPLQGTPFTVSAQDSRGQTSSENAQEPADVEIFSQSHLNPTTRISRQNNSPEVQCSDDEVDAIDVEMIAESVSDIPSTALTAARSIPDSDDDVNELSDVVSSQEKKKSTPPTDPATTKASTLEASPSRKDDSPRTEITSSPTKPKSSPMQPPPKKTPNTSIKTPSLPASPHTSPPVPKATLPDSSSSISPSNSSKDILISELKAIKIASILARNASLAAEIATQRAALSEITAQLANPAHETVKRHIKLLHDYNDIRDVGQGLVGMIADNRGVRIGELYGEFGVGLKD